MRETWGELAVTKVLQTCARWMVEGYEGRTAVSMLVFYVFAVAVGLGTLVEIWRCWGLATANHAAVPVVVAIAAILIGITVRLKRWLEETGQITV